MSNEDVASVKILIISQFDYCLMTSITLKTETKDLLKQIGSKGETYDDIIMRLVKSHCIQIRNREYRDIFENEEFTEIDWDDYL